MKSRLVVLAALSAAVIAIAFGGLIHYRAA